MVSGLTGATALFPRSIEIISKTSYSSMTILHKESLNIQYMFGSVSFEISICGTICNVQGVRLLVCPTLGIAPAQQQTSDSLVCFNIYRYAQRIYNDLSDRRISRCATIYTMRNYNGLPDLSMDVDNQRLVWLSAPRLTSAEVNSPEAVLI